MKALLIALWNNTGTHHLPERASAAAYYLLFAGLPFVVALLDVLTLLHLDDQLRTLQLVIEETFPPDISTLFLAELSRVVEARSAPRALLAFGLAVYSGEKAVNSLIQGVNAAYATPTPRNMLLDRLMAAIMTGLGLLVSLFVVFLLAGGAWAFTMMAERGLISMGTLSTLTVLRMPVVLLTLHLLVNVLYRVAADTPSALALGELGQRDRHLRLRGRDRGLSALRHPRDRPRRHLWELRRGDRPALVLAAHRVERALRRGDRRLSAQTLRRQDDTPDAPLETPPGLGPAAGDAPGDHRQGLIRGSVLPGLF
ncbi:MAG: YihY/virulence factor BrkB family protein [Deltaproteobacteria bacterium]|nr:YihY/virulence factor BrkB family protein [Deltaproteobacteria bacterium]